MGQRLDTRDARRRPRIQVPSRTHLKYAFGGAEGIVALLLSLPLFAFVTASEALVLVIAATLVYAYSALGSARKFLAYVDTRQPYALQAFVSWIIATIVAVLAARLFFGAITIHLPVLIIWAGFGAVAVSLLRAFVYDRFARLLQEGRLQIERVAVIGETHAVRRFKKDANIWKQGSQIVATHELETLPPSHETVAAFARECVANRCEHMLVVGDLNNIDLIESIVRPCRPFAINLMFSPTPAGNGRPLNMVDIVPLGQVNAVRVLSTPLDETGRALKRTFDIAGAGLGLLILSPLFLIIAIAIRATSPGPALYQQNRRGFNGETFSILKFRSMRVMETDGEFKQAQFNDDRVTPIGRFIRRTSIDELPQLINVLRGDMSLIGPRPHAIRHDDELTEKFDLYAQRQRIKPGITGWAQVNGFRGDTSTLDKIEGRTMHDLYYVENWSLLFDCWIILLTLFSRRMRQNAH